MLPAAEIAARSDWPLVLKGVKLAGSIQRKPSVPISASGTSFRTVVTIWTKPASGDAADVDRASASRSRSAPPRG